MLYMEVENPLAWVFLSRGHFSTLLRMPLSLKFHCSTSWPAYESSSFLFFLHNKCWLSFLISKFPFLRFKNKRKWQCMLINCFLLLITRRNFWMILYFSLTYFSSFSKIKFLTLPQSWLSYYRHKVDIKSAAHRSIDGYCNLASKII